MRKKDSFSIRKRFLQCIFKIFYRVETAGFENLRNAGKRVLITSNHLSFLDLPLLANFIPANPLFAVDKSLVRWPYSLFIGNIDIMHFDPTDPECIKTLIKELTSGRPCVVFPEKHMSHTGSLAKIYDSVAMAAETSDAQIVPVRLDGVQYTPFTNLKGKLPSCIFPKIKLTALAARKLDIAPNIKNKDRQAAAGNKLYTLMEEMIFTTSNKDRTLYQALLDISKMCKASMHVVEDVQFKPLSYRALIKSTVTIGRKLSKITRRDDNVGILLPNSNGAVISFFSLIAHGRTPAMMNLSAGVKALTNACSAAQIKTIVTSRRFIATDEERLGALVDTLAQYANIVYLEDIKASVTLSDKIRTAITNPERMHKNYDVKPDDPAVVLFTSGSEGAPKGVILSHTNIISNILQFEARVDYNQEDSIFCALPMFHSFGMTVGILLPILSGMKVFVYPSPLHYRAIPEMVYSIKATIMFGTDTFLRGYAKTAHPYDFQTIRFIVSGAEKAKEETKYLYFDKYDVRILEGYGATETSPVLTVNTQMHTKPESAGRILPGIEHKLVKVPGIQNGGRLFVKGPNVMLGYYRAENPGVIDPPENGWYDTGDIVNIDENGFTEIIGRAKRFAKIAGEMISLTSVETIIQKIYPDAQHVVVSVPDPRKGEKLVLISTQENANTKEIIAYTTQSGISELSVPRTIITTEQIPVLGSGKTDYSGVQDFVNKKLNIESVDIDDHNNKKRYA